MIRSPALKPIALACATLLAGSALAAGAAKPAAPPAQAAVKAAPEPLSAFLDDLLKTDRRIKSAQSDLDK